MRCGGFESRGFAAGIATLVSAMVAGCGGGGGSSSEPNPTPAYNFVADSGVRATGGVQPVELVVGSTTYMYLGSPASSGKVLASTDGITFAAVQATIDGIPLLAGTWFSFVVLPSGGFRMYQMGAPGSLISATSTDGLTWTSESGTRVVLNTIAVPKVVALLGGGYRVYYTTSGGGPQGIASASSSDGLSFAADPGVRLSVVPGAYSWGDPNVVVSGSTYLMSVTQGPANHSFSSLWLSSSSDGLSWTDPIPIITSSAGSPVDSSMVPLSNGVFRVYYGLFINSPAVPSPGAQSEILSGVLTKAAS